MDPETSTPAEPRPAAPVLRLRSPADPAALHRQVAALARSAGTLVIDLGGFAGEGFAAVELLARLALTARRHGGRVRLRGVPDELGALLAALGLADALGVSPPDPGTSHGR
ncbi:STAS domain-containing protein [Streptomyces sp. NPDC088923]|uniref:STAS domain-containing protein n=1 Tax=Streptomyces sp. NPDC088923 TaxID=3365913 RepID=UPI003827CED1